MTEGEKAVERSCAAQPNPLRVWWNKLSWIERRRLRKMVKPARGVNLDRLAFLYGVERLRVWWIFKESDRKLRARVLDVVRGFNAGRSLGVHPGWGE